MRSNLQWHEWFAWYPVNTLSGRWVWLKKVKRSRVDNGLKGSEGHRAWWIFQNIPNGKDS